MSVDYDAPRTVQEDEAAEPFDELKTGKAAQTSGAVIDLDEADLAEGFELPRADLSKEELLVQIVPVQADEFTHVLLPCPSPQPTGPGGKRTKVMHRV